MEEISIKLKGIRVPVDQISKLKAGASHLGKPYEKLKMYQYSVRFHIIFAFLYRNIGQNII